MARSNPQLQLKFSEHGGKRKNAGRKKLKADEQKHDKRERVTRHTPLHITMKLRRGYINLRCPRVVAVFARASKRAREFGLCITEYSLQSNHLHFLCEAPDNKVLSAGMSSLATAFAIAIQKLSGHKGAVFSQRYHAHVLKTPTEVKRALKYVLFNHNHHTKTELSVDAFSSGAACELSEDPPPWAHFAREAVTEPRCWLLRDGWLRGR